MNEAQWQMGVRIRSLREERHLTREQFSESAEISPKFLYEVESGLKGISANTLAKICCTLHVSADYILFGEDNSRISEELMHSIQQFNSEQVKLIENILNLIRKPH